jgi:hypothetical protein
MFPGYCCSGPACRTKKKPVISIWRLRGSSRLIFFHFSHLLQGTQQIFGFIKGHRTRWSVELMCQTLEVSRSGYYAWDERKPSKRKQDDTKFKGILFKAFHESNRTYGCGRLESVLEDNNINQQYGNKRAPALPPTPPTERRAWPAILPFRNTLND